MKRLLWLYPPSWRRRYGREVEWLLEETPPSAGAVVDLLRGSVDAWTHPQWQRGSLPPWARTLGSVCLLLAFVISSAALETAVFNRFLNEPPGPFWAVPLAASQVALWTVGAVLSRLAGARLLTWFCGLLALRYLVDPALSAGNVHLVSFELDHTFDGSSAWMGLLTGLADNAWWVLCSAVLLRRAGMRTPLAALWGCGIQLLLGPDTVMAATILVTGGGSLAPGVRLLPPEWLLLVSYYALPFLAPWAATLAALLAWRHRPLPRPDWWDDRGHGAAVPSRPLPDAPPALAASLGSGRRSGPE